MKNQITKWGLIGGVVASVLFLGPIAVNAEKYMDPENMGSGEVIGYSVMILSMLCVFFGVRAYRNKNNVEHFTFLKALGVGLQITIVANVIFYLANVMLYEVIAPDFLTEFGAFYKEYMLENAPDEAAREQVLAQFEAESAFLENGFLYALIMAGTTFFIGVIISLISALSLKRTETRTT